MRRREKARSAGLVICQPVNLLFGPRTPDKPDFLRGVDFGARHIVFGYFPTRYKLSIRLEKNKHG